ncbi:MAG: NTP transferase domain-containing protein [candidate division Zixibacteria bacterium]|nr:NTP transferase domain-containing protein [candidate division Zixibacteria bacterium]
MNYGIILAGGKGERFWPLSTRKTPKQLLKLTSNKIMLEETIDRLEGFIPLDRVLVVTGADLEEKILNSVKKLSKNNLLLEPQGKNTCLALALAAVHIQIKDPDGVMVVLSSDHIIEPKEQMIKIIAAAANVAAKEEKLITIGITPTRPETGYGYIEMGSGYSVVNDISFYEVSGFKEKPERPKAHEYYLDRKHLWNSGMFVWSIKAFLKAIKQYMPNIHACLQTYISDIEISDGGNEEPLKCLYRDCSSISVDFAILEKADNVLCAKADIKWDDVGSWLAMQRIHATDKMNNIIIGNVLLDSTYESTVINDSDDELIVGYGIADLVVVKTDRVIMVAHKSKVNDIKELLNKLEQDGKYQQYL